MLTERFKYPRTLHFPWTEHSTTDDKIHANLSHFEGREGVCTEKLDGEGTTMARDYVHARSTASKDHLSRHPMKQLWGTIRTDIPEGWRICGENVAAQHSIHYYTGKRYFWVFNIWDENNKCLSWDDTVDVCDALNLNLVPTLYRGEYDEKKIKACYTGKSFFDGSYDVETYKKTGLKKEVMEGYVWRVTDGFDFPIGNDAERLCIMELGKFVRKGHVTTSDHWLNEAVIWND